MAAFSEEFLTENYFEVILAAFFCYGANFSEAIDEVAWIKKVITNAPCVL